MLIVAQVTAIARAELRKGTALVPGKGSLRSVDRWGLAANEGIRAKVVNHPQNCVRVEFDEGGLEVRRGEGTVGQKWGDDWKVFGSEGLLH